jgi:hypothetical protein
VKDEPDDRLRHVAVLAAPAEVMTARCARLRPVQVDDAPALETPDP